MRQGFWRELLCVVFFSVFIFHQAEAERQPQQKKGLIGESPLRGRIVELNEEYRFAVINIGSADGVKKGMVFNVFQRDEEIAKIKVAKMRRHISACDIQLVYAGGGIAPGDLIVAEETPALVKLLRPLEATRMVEVEPIVVDIDAPKRVIFKKAREVFENFSVMIMELDNNQAAFKAQKYFEVPVAVAMATEWGPQVRNRVYYSVEVTPLPRYNRLIIRLREAYEKEGQLYDYEIEKISPVYKEAQEMAFTIKELSERL